MKKKEQKKYRSIRIWEEDYKKIKKWAAIRDMKMSVIIHLIVEKD